MLDPTLHKPPLSKRLIEPLPIAAPPPLRATREINGATSNPRKNKRQIRNIPRAPPPCIHQRLLQHIPRILLTPRLLTRKEQQPGTIPDNPMPPSDGKCVFSHRKIMFALEKRHHAPLLFHATQKNEELRRFVSPSPSIRLHILRR
jgi:hypothetical protein